MEKIDSMDKAMKAMEFMRKHPGERIPYLSDEENDKYDMYVAAKRDADEELASKLEKEISSSPCWFLIDMYAELDEKRRRKYNEGKPTLVQIFNDWADGKIDDAKAKRLYNQIELFKVKHDELDQYTNDGPINFVGDDNSLFELNFAIRERFGIEDEDEMGVKFKRAIGMIADPDSKPLVIGRLKFVTDEDGDLQVVGYVDESDDDIGPGETPFGGASIHASDCGFEFYNDYYVEPKGDSGGVTINKPFLDPDYMPNDNDSPYAPKPLIFDSNINEYPEEGYYNKGDYTFRKHIRYGIEIELKRLLEDNGRNLSSVHKNNIFNMVLELLPEMALITFVPAGRPNFIDDDEIIKRGAKMALAVLNKYNLI